MSEYEKWFSLRTERTTPTLTKVVEVVHGLKQIALVVKVQLGGVEGLALYRPEKTLKISPDIRVPLPEELYRDVAYSRLDQFLGWNVAAPVIPWQIKPGDTGVLRPYWPNITKVEEYEISLENLQADLAFWQKVAILDYLTGVVDRNANDMILVGDNHQKVILDSGLSFVDGVNFVVQQSVVRETLQGTIIMPKLLKELSKICTKDIVANIGDLFPQTASQMANQVMRRGENLLTKEIII